MQGYRGHGDAFPDLLMRQSHLLLQDILFDGYPHAFFEAVNQGRLGAARMRHDIGQSDFFVNMIVNITQNILDLTIRHFGVECGSTFFDVLVKHQIHEALNVSLVIIVVGRGAPTAEMLQLQGSIAFKNNDVLCGLTEGFLQGGGNGRQIKECVDPAIFAVRIGQHGMVQVRGMDDGVVRREMVWLSLDQHGDIALQKRDHFIAGMAVLLANDGACDLSLDVFDSKILGVEISVHITTSLYAQYIISVPKMQGDFKIYTNFS